MGKTIAMAAMVAICFGALGFGATTFDTSWFGGMIDIDFTSGDDYTATFDAMGSTTQGEFHAVDSDDNPYNYGVDSSSAYVKSNVNNGWMRFITERLDSKSSYGPAGQKTDSYVQATGTGEIAFGNRINYAECSSCGYGWRKTYGATTNGMEFEATGDYLIDHNVYDGQGDMGFVYTYGTGSAMIKLMGERATGTGGFNMGHLPVCGDGEAWDDNYAKYVGTGTGFFQVYAEGTDSVGVHEGGFTIPGDGVNKAIYNLQVNYSGSFTWDDFGVKGN